MAQTTPPPRLTTVTGGLLIPVHGERDPELPIMYRVLNHPLSKRQGTNDSTAMVYLADLTEEGMLKTVEVGARQRIPGPGKDNMMRSGAVECFPNETIYIRDMNGDGDPLKDREHSFVVAKSKQSAETVSLMDTVTDRIIGDRSDCTADVPGPEGSDIKTGGTAFERSIRAKPVPGTTRAFTLGPSHEPQSNTSAPHATGKMYHNEWDEHLALQKDIIAMHIGAAMNGLRHGPDDLLENLERHAGLVPMPRIGTDDNVAFTSVQLNIAPVGTFDSSTMSVLGEFGSEHIDGNDSEHTFSSAGTYSNLDPTLYHPGYFFYLDIMVCVRMDQGVLAYFNGLRPHGSSSAICLHGLPPPDAYRIVLVAYAVRHILEAWNILPIAALPGKDTDLRDRLLSLVPEMTPNIYHYEARGHINHATWITDGETMMTRRSHLQFIVSSLCFMLCYILNQFPAQYQVHFDTKTFCDLITISDEDGRRIKVDDWPQRPTLSANVFPTASTSTSGVDAEIPTDTNGSAFIRPQGNADNSPLPRSDIDTRLPSSIIPAKSSLLALPINNLAHRNPIRERDAILWEEHAERHATLIPLARLFRSRESAKGAKYIPGVLGGRPRTKSKQYKALYRRAKLGLVVTLDGKDGGNKIPQLLDPNRIINKRKRKGTAVKTKDVAQHDSSSESDDEVQDLEPDSDDDEYTPAGSSNSRPAKKPVSTILPVRSVHRASRSTRLVEVVIPFTMPKTRTLVSKPAELTQPHSELSLTVSSELLSTVRANDSTVNTRRHPNVDATKPPIIANEMDCAIYISSDDEMVPLPPDLPLVPPVLTTLSLTLITAAANNLKKSAKALMDRYGVVNAPRLIATDVILQPMLQAPASEMAGISVARLWQNMPTLGDSILLTSFDIAIKRQDLMLLNHAAWKWLRVVCSDNCWSHLLNPGPADNWIKQVTDKVTHLIDTKHTTFLFISSKYLTTDVPVEYMWTRSQHAKRLVGDEAHVYILKVVTEIVRCWLGYPVQGVEEAQSRFVGLAIDYFSTDVLLLEAFWKSYNKFKSQVIGDRKVTRVVEHHFDALLAHISSHPLADKDSAERLRLSDIGQIINAYRFGKLSTLFPGQLDASAPPPLPITCSEELSTFEGSNPALMLNFLQLLLPFLDPSLPDNSLLRNVRSNLDFYLPFREHAPGRLRATSANGPFAVHVVSSSKAFFCALWWRGISFGTQFAKDETMMFDLEEVMDYYTWKQMAHGDAAADHYFCDPSIFGSYNPGRTIASGEQYWTSSQTYVNWLSSPEPPKYLAQWNYFRSTRIQQWDADLKRHTFVKNAFNRNIKAFPQIGDLIAHLLTADYVYAGKVKMPTLEEMGEIIHHVDAGGVSGLRLMGYFGKGRPSQTKVIASLTHLHKYLVGKLLDSSIERMTFDVIMLEHALCKLSRATNHGWI